MPLPQFSHQPSRLPGPRRQARKVSALESARPADSSGAPRALVSPGASQRQQNGYFGVIV